MSKNILVITPTLGDRTSLKRTIESVRDIGGNYVKHIIIAPIQKIERLKNIYNEIDCIPEPINSNGIYTALNYAFKTFGKQYKYITFINDDDYWLANFKLLINEILNNDCDMVYGKIKFYDEQKQSYKKMASSSSFKYFIPLLHHSVILFTQQATIIKSDLFFELGGFDEKYKLAADTKLWAQLSLKNLKYKYLPKECAVYTLQNGQLSSNHEIGTIEHQRLLQEFPIKKYKTIIPLLIYRIKNIPIYLYRIFNL